MRKVLFILLSVLIIYNCNNNKIYFGQSISNVEGYFNIENSKVLERGVRANAKIYNIKNEELEDIIKKIGNEVKVTKTTNLKNSGLSIDFNSKNLNGYIEKDETKLIIYLKSENNNISLNSLENSIYTALRGKTTDITIGKYLVSVYEDQNSKTILKNINNTFKENNAEDIEISEIGEGKFSITANTNCFNTKKIAGKNLDINIAVLKYNSGCKIVIGTPIIPISY